MPPRLGRSPLVDGRRRHAGGAPRSCGGECREGEKGIVSRSRQKPVLFLARLKKDSTTGEWSYTIKRNLNKGADRLTAVGVDKAGAAGNAGGSKLGVVRSG